jgi:hypothetical protein
MKPIEIQMEIQKKCMIFFVGIQALPHCQDMPLHMHGAEEGLIFQTTDS